MLPRRLFVQTLETEQMQRKTNNGTRRVQNPQQCAPQQNKRRGETTKTHSQRHTANQVLHVVPTYPKRVDPA